MVHETESKTMNFHKIAIELLREVFQSVADCITRQGREVNDPALWMEISRILASNVVIGQYLGLGTEKVTGESELGLTHISQNYRGSDSSVYENLRKIRLPEKMEIIEALYELTPYQLTKLLEAIHQVMVYEKVQFSFKGEIAHRRPDGGNNEKWLRGAFYTPSEVTKFICENTVGSYLDRRINRISLALSRTNPDEVLVELDKIFDLRTVDPACGPGSFLTESLTVIKSRYATISNIYKRLRESGIIRSDDRSTQILKDESSFVRHFQENIYGVDLDSAAIEVAAICLSIVSGRQRNLKFSLDLNLKEGNSLISELPIRLRKPSREEIRTLLELRNRIRRSTTTPEKRTKLVEAYKGEMDRLERGLTPIVKGAKRASQFFESLREKEPFCWELEFPEVFLRNHDTEEGFDILVMNPPYDNLKLNVSEFRSQLDEAGLKRFKEARKRECEYFRRSGHYRLSNKGMLNYYRLMVERALNLTSKSSLLGFIIPSTFLSDRSASNIRKEILHKYCILGIFDFPESAHVFRGVNQAVCIVLIDKSYRGKVVPLANLRGLDELDRVKPTDIAIGRIEKAFPRDLSIPKITGKGLTILEKMHWNPRLSEISWIRNLRGEVDLTFYRDCLSQEDTGRMLVRGSHITRYLLRWNPDRKEGFILKDRFLRRLGSSVKAKHTKQVRIVGQQISNMMQRWRLKFCLVPPGTFLGNSCNYLVISGEEERVKPLRLYLLALLNSCILNWRFKLTSTNNHINNYELGSLPIKIINWNNSSEVRLFKIIAGDVERIIQAGEVIDMSPRVEAAISLLYDLTSEEVRFILESGKFEKRESEGVIKYLSKLREVAE